MRANDSLILLRNWRVYTCVCVSCMCVWVSVCVCLWVNERVYIACVLGSFIHSFVLMSNGTFTIAVKTPLLHSCGVEICTRVSESNWLCLWVWVCLHVCECERPSFHFIGIPISVSRSMKSRCTQIFVTVKSLMSFESNKLSSNYVVCETVCLLWYRCW